MASHHTFFIILIVVNFCKAAVTSPFDLSNYNNTCRTTNNNNAPTDCEECADFDAVVKSAMLFACQGHEEFANTTIDLAAAYISKWSPGRTYGVVMSIQSVNLIAQFTQFYSKTINNRNAVGYKISEATEIREKVNLLDLENTLPPAKNITDELIVLLVKYILQIRALVDLTIKYGLSNIFFTEALRHDILNETTFLSFIDILNKSLISEKSVATVNMAVFTLWPTFVGVTFVLGITANAILLLIFMRHSEMRTVHNVMLANLAVMDLISLIFNLPLTYFMFSKPGNFHLLSCQCFLFIRSLTLGVCTYSVVIISFQRLRAVSKFKANRTTRLSSTLLLVGLWFAVIAYSIPAFFLADTDREHCKYNESVFIYYVSIEFIAMCLLPAVLVAVFSIITSIKLKKSAENIPGERMGQEKRIRDRIVTSRVLIGLVVVFVVSYLPKYLFDILITTDETVWRSYTNIRNDDWGFYITMALFIETTLFLNAALNPIVLYFLSTKFKKYFNNYIFCRCRSEIS